ncbi:MAG: hypothetical protein AB7O59_23220 [Pirellulales bacterium]
MFLPQENAGVVGCRKSSAGGAAARRRLQVASMLAALLLSTEIAMSGEPGAAPAPANVLTLEVFIRSDSDRSSRAAEFVRQLPKKRRGLRVVVHDLFRDTDARQLFADRCKKFAVANPALPAFFACNQVRLGFADAAKSGPAIENLFTIRAFVRQGCVHCRDAKRFLADLEQRWPAVRVELHDVVASSAAAEEMDRTASRHHAQVSALPAIELCGRFVVGYDTDATSGRQLENILRDASAPSSAVAERHSSTTDRARFPGTLAGYDGSSSIRLVRLGPQQTDRGQAAPAHVPPLPPVAEEESTMSAPPPAAGPEGIELPGWGMLQVGDLGLPAFTFVIGLVDGFNPCAMWVLIFLLSILVNVRSRAKILAIAGTFVLVSGLAYFAFMAAWLNVFLLIGYMRPLQIALGVLAVMIGIVNVKDFVAFKRGITLSIPEAAKQGIYARVRDIVAAKYLSTAVAMAVVLAISVNIVELLCTAGLPALYTQILTVQELPPWQNYAYLSLYILAYMLDDSLMLGLFVVTLSHRKVQEREGRWLKLTSGVVILALGLVMLFKPQWLALSGLV